MSLSPSDFQLILQGALWLLCNFLSWYLRNISTLILVSYAIYVLLPCHAVSQGLINQKLCLSGYDPEGNVPEPPPTHHWSQFMKDRLFTRGAEGSLLLRCKGKMTRLERLVRDLASGTCWVSGCPVALCKQDGAGSNCWQAAPLRYEGSLPGAGIHAHRHTHGST